LRGRIAFDYEGIPRHDLFGKSQGFRQPGWTIAVAPGFTYTKGPGMLICEVPINFARFIDANATAVPGLPIMTASGPAPAPFNPKRNLGLIAPVGISLRYVRTF
jgi:hypothetical protein